MSIAVKGAEHEPLAGYPLIGRPPILVAGAGRAPTAGRVRVGVPELADSDITAELLDPFDPETVIATLDDSFDRSWLEQLNEAGSASISFAKEDDAAALIRDGSLIRLSLRGVPAAVMLVEPTDATLIDPSEEDGENVTYNGRLHIALMEWGVVGPSRGIRQQPVQEDRTFDYTAPEYDDSWWSSPVFIGAVQTVREFYFYSPGIGDFLRLFNETPSDLAKEFPDPFAAVLGPPGSTVVRGRPLPLDSGGDHYGRQWVDVPSSGSHRVFPLGDDSIDIAIDGVHVVQAGTGFMATGSGADIDLSAGRHLVSWHVNSRTDAQVAWALNPGGAFNAAYGAWSIFRADNINVNGFVAHSDTTAKVTPYLDEVPGMSPGRAIRLVKEENEADGALMPALGCTDELDSDGNPWRANATPTRVGNDMFTWLQEMGVTAIDFAMRVGPFVLDVWNQGARGVIRHALSFHGPTDLDDETTGNIDQLHKKTGTITNSFLIRTAYGWDLVERQSSIDEFGLRRALLGLGSYTDPALVAKAANKQLDIVAVPREQYDFEHLPLTDGEWAYHGFAVGDWVELDDGETTTFRRVVSIAPSEQSATDEDNTGEASVVVTLGDVVMFASPVEFHLAKLSQAVKKMSNGTALGDFKIAQPVTPPAKPAPNVAWQPAQHECGFFDAVPPGAVNVGSFGILAAGDTSIQQLFGMTWYANPFAIYTVIVRHPTLGGGVINTSSPSLTGGMTWTLLHESPTYDWNDGAGIRSYKAFYFVGVGPGVDGDTFFDIGAPQAVNLQIAFGVTSVTHVAPTLDSIRQQAVSDGGYAVLPSAPLQCSGILGSSAGESHGTGYSAPGGILGISNTGLHVIFNPADPTQIYRYGPISQEPDGAAPTGGSILIELIPLSD